MNKKRHLKLLLIAVSIMVLMLACNLGGSEEPTPVPPTDVPPSTEAPPPTDVPTEAPEPTEAPPTEAPVEEPTEEPVEEPIEEPVANTLAVTQVVGYFTEFDSIIVSGLVVNNTDRPVDDIEVEISLYDADDNSIYTDVTNTDLYTLAPGETSPFSLWIYEDLPDADSFDAGIVGQSSSDVDRATVDLNGVLMVVDDDDDIIITGKVTNNTDQPVKLNGLAAASFDADGKLFSANGYSVMVRYLDPGESGPFRVNLSSPEEGAADITDYELYVDAEYSDTEDYYDIGLPGPDEVSYFFDYFGSFHFVGELTNNSETSLSISLLATLYDDDPNTNPDAHVIDAASSSMPVFSVAPGEKMAFDFDFWGPMSRKEGTSDQFAYWIIQWDPYWTWEGFTEYVDITTQNDIHDFDNYGGKFTGEALNNTDAAVDGAVIIVTAYDKETGTIVAMGYDSIFDPIEAGDTALYEVYMDVPDDFDPDSVDFVITAKGELP